MGFLCTSRRLVGLVLKEVSVTTPCGIAKESFSDALKQLCFCGKKRESLKSILAINGQPLASVAITPMPCKSGLIGEPSMWTVPGALNLQSLLILKDDRKSYFNKWVYP